MAKLSRCPPVNDANGSSFDTLFHRQLISEDANFRWCPNPACGSGQLHEGDDPLWTCTECRRRACAVHNVDWHEGQTCEVYDRLQAIRDPQHRLDEGMSENHVRDHCKRCPNSRCRVLSYRALGCHHMTCKFVHAFPYPERASLLTKGVTGHRCQHEYCWYCLVTWSICRWEGHHHALFCPMYIPRINESAARPTIPQQAIDLLERRQDTLPRPQMMSATAPQRRSRRLAFATNESAVRRRVEEEVEVLGPVADEPGDRPSAGGPLHVAGGGTNPNGNSTPAARTMPSAAGHQVSPRRRQAASTPVAIVSGARRGPNPPVHSTLRTESIIPASTEIDARGSLAASDSDASDPSIDNASLPN